MLSLRSRAWQRCALVAVLGPALMCGFLAFPAVAGSIRGTVRDAASGKPLPNANVILVGSTRGTISDESGVFRLDRLEAGAVKLTIGYIGYETWESDLLDVPPRGVIRVSARLTTLPFEIDGGEATSTAEELQDEGVVNDEIPMDEFIDRPVDDVETVVELQANVFRLGDGLHVGGHRDGALEERVDGVSVRDPVSGRSIGIGMFAVESSNLVIGGQNAGAGGGMAGTLSHRTREGGARVRGQIFYETDDFGAPDKTFHNLDRVMVSLGGPLFHENVTWFGSGQGTWSDRYPATNATRTRNRLLDFVSIGDRKVNDVRLQGKLAWRLSPGRKLTVELISNRAREDRYRHNWSWEGYVQTFQDTVRSDGQSRIVTRRGAWAPAKLGEEWVYYNAADHTPTLDRWASLAKLAYTESFGNESVLDVRLAHNRFRERDVVNGRNPWEYEGESLQDLYLNHADSELSDYFARGGDMPTWRGQSSRVSTVVTSYVLPLRRHRFEAGFEARYNDIDVNGVSDMYVNRDAGIEIGRRDSYRQHQPEGSMYVLDKWEHEGMTVNVGARLEAFSPGYTDDVTPNIDRWKTYLSPRLGVAYPVTDRDVFSFHYGRYYQYPSRAQLYTNRSATDGRVRGNPDLEPETSTSYQAALEHAFGETVRGQFSVYYRDIFNLIAVRRYQTQENATGIPVFVNQDYGSARGFVASLNRRFGDGVTGELSYTYGVATGVASDPSSADQLDFRYFAISEQPLDWDVRHNVKAQFSIHEATWSVTGIWTLRSGLPFTPRDRDARDVEPELVNSRRLPADTALNLQAQKTVSVWGRNVRTWLRVDNALDTRTIVDLDGSTAFAAPGFDLDSYVQYYTETGKAGGAVVVSDQTGDGREDWQALADPSVFNSGRAVRMGLSMDF